MVRGSVRENDAVIRAVWYVYEQVSMYDIVPGISIHGMASCLNLLGGQIPVESCASNVKTSLYMKYLVGWNIFTI